jgi:hypothetical protein
MNGVRTLLLAEVAAFAAAALVHAGVIADGYQHREAMIAESVIALVLTLGLLAGMATPRWTRAAALAAQGFALLGTCVGIFTIIVGIGPQADFDVAVHAGLVVLLTVGLAVAARPGPSDFDERERARIKDTSGGDRLAPSSPSRSGR